MIVLIEGTPGSGKSYEATVYHALRGLRRGRKVITNLPLNPAAFAEIDPEFEDLIEMREDPDPDTPIFSLIEHYQSSWIGHDTETGKEIKPLYIIDECHRCLGQDIVDRQVADWFAMHRHQGVDIVLMTQNHSDVARTITNRVDHMIQVENLKRKGMTKLYMRRVYSDCGFRSRLEGQSTRIYSQQYFALYNSYTQGGSGLELGSSDIRKWYQEPQLILISVILLGACALGAYGLVGLISSGSFPLSPNTELLGVPKQKTTKTLSPPTAAAPAPGVPATTVIKDFEDLSLLRYSGVLSSNSGNLFLFSLGEGKSVVYSASDLQAAGYTVTAVDSCRITLKDSTKKQIISC